jgi:hypothetical protein
METTTTNIGVTKVGNVRVNETKMHDMDAEKEEEGCVEKKVETTAVKNVGMMTAVDNENCVNVSNSILIVFDCPPTDRNIISLYLIILLL